MNAMTNIAAEAVELQREIRDLREALDDAGDAGQISRLRLTISARERRLEELDREAAGIAGGWP
jgi:hypothetical protein